MVNEVVVRQGGYDTYNFTCADGTGIEKGTILKLTDPRTAIASSAQGDVLAGIAAREKVANDGRTSIAVIRDRAIVDVKASGAIAIGQPVVSAGAYNEVKYANASGAAILGYALETAATGETFNLLVQVGAGSTAYT